MATYTVKKGDTLTKIANKLGTTVRELAKKNNISNVNKINIGQRLSYDNVKYDDNNKQSSNSNNTDVNSYIEKRYAGDYSGTKYKVKPKDYTENEIQEIVRNNIQVTNDNFSGESNIVSKKLGMPEENAITDIFLNYVDTIDDLNEVDWQKLTKGINEIFATQPEGKGKGNKKKLNSRKRRQQPGQQSSPRSNAQPKNPIPLARRDATWVAPNRVPVKFSKATKMNTKTGKVYWSNENDDDKYARLRVAIDPETRLSTGQNPNKPVKGAYIVGNDRYFYYK